MREVGQKQLPTSHSILSFFSRFFSVCLLFWANANDLKCPHKVKEKAKRSESGWKSSHRLTTDKHIDSAAPRRKRQRRTAQNGCLFASGLGPKTANTFSHEVRKVPRPALVHILCKTKGTQHPALYFPFPEKETHSIGVLTANLKWKTATPSTFHLSKGCRLATSKML